MLRLTVAWPVCSSINLFCTTHHQIFVTVCCRFVDFGRQLRRDGGSVGYNSSRTSANGIQRESRLYLSASDSRIPPSPPVGQGPDSIFLTNSVAQLHPQALGSLLRYTGLSWRYSSGLHAGPHHLNLKLLCDRRSVDLSALVSGNRFRTLRLSSWEAPSLTRGRVCNLFVQLLLALASAVTLGSKSRRTRDHISLSHWRLGSLSVACYDSQDYGGGILTRVYMG
jgi:hypothetical protein